MNHLPLFYYPTTTLCIDDDPLILQSVITIIGEDHRTKAFQSPRVGLDFLTRDYVCPSNQLFLRGEQSNEHYGSLTHAPVDFDVTSLAQIAENPRRFDEIAVMVIDYNMPDMTGFDLAKACQHLPLHKILLTGEAKPAQAIYGFNDNLIERYINKSDAELAEKLSLYLNQLRYKYFQIKTYSLLSHLEAEIALPLTDAVFIAFFEDYLLQHQIKEYYLIDKKGSFLCIDAADKRFYLVVYTDRQLDEWLAINNDEENIYVIKERKKIPFFGLGRESWHYKVEEWPTYYYTPQVLTGRERYFLASIQNKQEVIPIL